MARKKLFKPQPEEPVRLQKPPPPASVPPVPAGQYARMTRNQNSRPSVGIRRITSSSLLDHPRPVAVGSTRQHDDHPGEHGGRRRSASDPQGPNLHVPGSVLERETTRPDIMPSVAESPDGTELEAFPEIGRAYTTDPHLEAAAPQHDASSTIHDFGAAPIAPYPTAPAHAPEAQAAGPSTASNSWLNFSRRRRGSNASQHGNRQRGDSDTAGHPVYDSDMVDLLDVIDPEVSTLSTLTNVQNSLFVPDLGGWLNRRPTYTLSARPSQMTVASRKQPVETAEIDTIQDEVDQQAQLQRTNSLSTITSRLTESRYAVLPHGMNLEGWTSAEKEELNDHVRHLLHSKRAAFKRSMRGFGQYVRHPLGAFVTIYAFLITVFGLVWVLFLIGWISVGGRRSYDVNVIDNVLVALFAIIGDGLAPFRAVDTYHMIYIAHYHHLTWRLRNERQMPKLEDHNDLPEVPEIEALDTDIEAQAQAANPEEIVHHHENEWSVLTPKQQQKLKYHQDKFAKSHTFYKPHETETHFAFPLRLLVAIVVLLDCHSLLQISLGTCTWAISYHVRPFALTTVILCCSITVNILGGVLISIGDRRTRKKDVRERMFRQQLTEDAIHKLEKRKQREGQRNDELEKVVTPDSARASVEREPAESVIGSAYTHEKNDYRSPGPYEGT